MTLSYTPAQINRFWIKVDRFSPTGNWLWTAARNQWGRGIFGISHSKLIQAHRFAAELALGRHLEPGEWVLHDCPGGDEPSCVCNDPPGWKETDGILYPQFGHLWIGDHAANMRDMVAKGRSCAGERHNSVTHPDSVGRGDTHWSHRTPERVPRGADSWVRQHPERMARGDHHGSKTRPESVQRGEAHHQAVQTVATVREIRRRRAIGERLDILAVEFGTSITNISNIARHRSWKHVE